MLRKTILAGAAALTLGAAALAPTSASAWWGGHPGWHGLHHGWFYRPAVRAYARPIYGGCFVRRLVWTPYGPAPRWVNVCY
ncbi:MAG: sulfur globule protein precursor [Xanthobacteraceae bacterium]